MTVGLDKDGNMRKALLTQLKRNGMGESPKAEKQAGLPKAPRMTGTRKQRLRVAVNLTAAGAVRGGFWGTLIGPIFLNPLLGFAMGAAAGAASGALTDVGINDYFMKESAVAMTAGSSTLFVLVRKATPDKMLEELKGTGGRVLKTSLSHEDETKLQATLSAAR
jgi:uncharacterized membrane protein